MKNALIILILIYAGKCEAQFNDSLNYYAKYASSGVINTTNDGTSYILTNAARFSIGKQSLKLNLSGSYIYGRQGQKTTNDDITTGLDFNIYQTPKFYYWGLGSFDKSLSLKVDSRYQSGLGAAYVLVDNPYVYLNISDGILYEASDIYLKDETRELYNTFRNSFRLIYRFSYKNIVKLEGTHFIQNSLSDGSDYILRSNNTLSVKLSNWLSISASLAYNRINRNTNENLLINYGVTIEKYF